MAAIADLFSTESKFRRSVYSREESERETNTRGEETGCRLRKDDGEDGENVLEEKEGKGGTLGTSIKL